MPQNGGKYNVIVAGGGPAGIGAALAAAVGGAKTLLLEARVFFGGVAEVMGWMPMNRILQNGASRGGVHEIFTNKIKSYEPVAAVPGKANKVDGDSLDIHPDYLRLAVMELMEEYGCDYLTGSPVTGVIKEGGSMRAVRCGGKFGEREYFAQVFVDATGDGDVAFHAGAPMQKGRESDGRFMSVTLGFVLANVDEDRFFKAYPDSFIAVNERMREHAAANNYAFSSFYGFDRTTVPGMLSVNNGNLEGLGVIDGTDIRDLNAAHRAGMQVAVDFVRIARDMRLPGLEEAHLARTGQDVGIRETRRIVGEYVMDVEDSIKGVEFEDVVARRYGTIDPVGFSEEYVHMDKIVNGHAYPYRCLLPLRVEGLLAAGRCASLTHLGAATCKSMGNMMGIGQAAGAAAAVCAREGVMPRNADVSKVQGVLRGMGVRLGKNDTFL